MIPEPGDLLLADPDPRESRRTKIARRFTIFAAFLLLSIALIGVLYTVAKVRETQLDNRTTLETTKHAAQDAEAAAEAAKVTAARVEDCTTVGGECYAAGQKRTGQAVAAITDQGLRAAAAIAACQARGVTEFRPLVRCAVGLLTPPEP